MAVELAMRTNSLRSGFVHFFTRCTLSLTNCFSGCTMTALTSDMAFAGALRGAATVTRSARRREADSGRESCGTVEQLRRLSYRLADATRITLAANRETRFLFFRPPAARRLRLILLILSSLGDTRRCLLRLAPASRVFLWNQPARILCTSASARSPSSSRTRPFRVTCSPGSRQRPLPLPDGARPRERRARAGKLRP